MARKKFRISDIEKTHCEQWRYFSGFKGVDEHRAGCFLMLSYRRDALTAALYDAQT